MSTQDQINQLVQELNQVFIELEDVRTKLSNQILTDSIDGTIVLPPNATFQQIASTQRSSLLDIHMNAIERARLLDEGANLLGPHTTTAELIEYLLGFLTGTVSPSGGTIRFVDVIEITDEMQIVAESISVDMFLDDTITITDHLLIPEKPEILSEIITARDQLLMDFLPPVILELLNILTATDRLSFDDLIIKLLDIAEADDEFKIVYANALPALWSNLIETFDQLLIPERPSGMIEAASVSDEMSMILTPTVVLELSNTATVTDRIYIPSQKDYFIDNITGTDTLTLILEPI